MTLRSLFSRVWGCALLAVVLPMTLGAGPVGVNGTGPIFVDAVKNAFSEFYSADKGEKLTTDAHGWPTSGDAQLNVWDARVNMPWDGPDPLAVPQEMNGTYALSFTGKADVSPQEKPMFKIENLKYDPATNRTTADLVVPHGQYLNVMKFTHLGAGGIRDLKLIRPGYAPDTKQLFTNEFLTAVKPFVAIRCMDYLAMNGYGAAANHEQYPATIDWADRRLPSDAVQTGGRGAKIGLAWDYLIDLANTTGKDLWINIPCSASAVYVQHLAELMHKNLDPKLHIYIEDSNEVWNGGFSQHAYNHDAAVAEGESDHSFLHNDGNRNPDVMANRRHAERTVEFGDIFAKEFGETTRTGRIRPVLMGFWIDPNGIRESLAWVDRTFGPPATKLYGAGAAWYIDAFSTVDLNATLNTMVAYDGQNRRNIGILAEVTAFFGIKQVAYEGGAGLSGGKDLAVKIAANRDPRIGQILRNHFLNNWFAQGGDLYCYYHLGGSYGPYGSWGLLEGDFHKLNTPKYLALLKVIAAPQPQVRIGAPLPDRIGGSAAIDESQTIDGNNKPNTTLTDHAGSLHQYLLNVPSAGTYQFIIEGRGGKEGILVDNHKYADAELPAKVTVDLKPGLHGLWLLADGDLTLGAGGRIVIVRKR